MTTARPTAGLRERKKRATRDRILAAAFDLFSSEGYDQATLQHIAERADVSPRTVGNYFGQKVDLLVAYRETMLDAAADAAARSEGRPPLERIRATLTAAARENERHPNGRVAQALIAQHASYRALAEVQDRFAALLWTLLEPGLLRADVDDDLAILALVSAYVAVQQRWARDRRPSLAADTERVVELWAKGAVR